MSEYISKRLRQEVERRARRRCEYCLSLRSYTTESFAVEHIIPVVRGGATVSNNLALSCSGCNGHKYDKIEAYDSVSEGMASLYHPRQHVWSDHFSWNADYTEIIGMTPTGRVTVETLELNREGVVNLRWVLYFFGLHPPEETRNR